MNDEDFRDVCAMLSMAGWIMNGDYSKEEIPHLAYRMADHMLKVRNGEQEVGITTVKPRKRTSK